MQEEIQKAIDQESVQEAKVGYQYDSTDTSDVQNSEKQKTSTGIIKFINIMLLVLLGTGLAFLYWILSKNIF